MWAPSSMMISHPSTCAGETARPLDFRSQPSHFHRNSPKKVRGLTQCSKRVSTWMPISSIRMSAPDVPRKSESSGAICVNQDPLCVVEVSQKNRRDSSALTGFHKLLPDIGVAHKHQCDGECGPREANTAASRVCDPQEMRKGSIIGWARSSAQLKFGSVYTHLLVKHQKAPQRLILRNVGMSQIWAASKP